MGIDNTIPEALLPNIKRLAEALERVRDLLASPIHINSGYRCPELNVAVRGVSTSSHCQGWAADFTSQYGTPTEICRVIADSTIPFDQCISEGKSPGWVHFSIAPAMRRLVMTATFDVAGNATYTKGLT
jgi:putative chitinase